MRETKTGFDPQSSQCVLRKHIEILQRYPQIAEAFVAFHNSSCQISGGSSTDKMYLKVVLFAAEPDGAFSNKCWLQKIHKALFVSRNEMITERWNTDTFVKQSADRIINFLHIFRKCCTVFVEKNICVRPCPN